MSTESLTAPRPTGPDAPIPSETAVADPRAARRRMVQGAGIVVAGIVTILAWGIGANSGDFAVAMAERNPDALVIAIEPVGDLADEIRNRAEAAGLGNIVVSEVAVAGERGKAQLNVALTGDRGVTSLLAFDEKSVDEDEYWRTREDLKFASTDTVDVRTLADLLREYGRATLDFVKIDVQGKDLEALLSAGELLGGVRAGMLEASATEHTRLYAGEPVLREVLQALREHGFDVYAVKPNDPAANEVNVYFVREGESPRAVEKELSLRGVHLYDGKHFWAVPCDSTEKLEAAQAEVGSGARLREVEDRNALLEDRVQEIEADVTAGRSALARAQTELTRLRRDTEEEVLRQAEAVTRMRAALDRALERLDVVRLERDTARGEAAALRDQLAPPVRTRGLLSRRLTGPARALRDGVGRLRSIAAVLRHKDRGAAG